MNTAMRASLTNTYLKRPNGLGHDQNYCRQQATQPVEAGVNNAQLLMLLPFEMMRQHLESVILRQLESAFGICSKRAEEMDNALVCPYRLRFNHWSAKVLTGKNLCLLFSTLILDKLPIIGVLLDSE